MDLEQRYDTKEVQIETESAKKTLEDIEQASLRENLTTQRLRMKMESCKHDLNAIKLKIKRWERMMRVVKIESNEIKSSEDKIHKKMSLFLNDLRILKVRKIFLSWFNQSHLVLFSDYIKL